MTAKNSMKYVEKVLERINKSTGASLFLFMGSNIAAKVNEDGGVHILKSGNAAQLEAYVDGVMDALSAIPRLAGFDENGRMKEAAK